MSGPVFVSIDYIDRQKGTWNVYVCTYEDGIQHALAYREIECSLYPQAALAKVWTNLREILAIHNVSSPNPMVIGCDANDLQIATNIMNIAQQSEDKLFTCIVKEKRSTRPGVYFKMDMYKLERLQKLLRNDALIGVKNIGYESPKQLADDMDALLLADDMEALFTSGTVYRGANVPHVLLAVEVACLAYTAHVGMDQKRETTRVA